MKASIQKRRAKERFNTASKLEKEYVKSMRLLVKQIDLMVKDIINVNLTEDQLKLAQHDLTRMLHQYSDTIKPWAKSIAEKMVLRLVKIDESDWIKLGRDMNRALKKELDDAPTGDMVKSFMAEQVVLITSLPKEAGDRVHEMTLKGITTGERAEDITKKILQIGNVTLSRARLIARTEVARTASALTMARSKHVGATHYYWRTSGDGDVRDSHKKMNGKIIEWVNAPEVELGKLYHAGMFPNCRCYPEPILDYEMK